MTPQEMHEQRLGLIAKQQDLLDKSIEEKREFTSEETEQYNKMEADAKDLKFKAEQSLALITAKAEQSLALITAKAELEKPIRAGVRPGVESEGEDRRPRATADYKRNFTQWAQYGDARTPVNVTAVLEKAVPSQGGYLVPQEWNTNIIKILLNANVMRQISTVLTTTLDTNLTFEATLPTFGWVDELGTYPTTDSTFGRKIFSAYKLGGIVKVSEELFQDAFLDMGALVADQGGRSAAKTEESAYVSGDGNKKPTGFTVEATGTYTTAAPAVISFDDIIGMIYATPRPYRANGSFLFSDTAVMSLRRAKTTTNEYIWQPSTTVGAPDRLYGYPFYTTDALAVVAATSKSGAFGDFKQYQILDRAGWSMQRINELYSETGQIGFKMSERTDGHLLRPDAITVLTQHA